MASTQSYASTLAVYYGQGANQPRLSTFCQDSTIDIIPIGFVTKFANNGKGGVIETNFANQCGATVAGTNYVYDCADLAADIPTCQLAGKKILISIGGGEPTNFYYLSTSAEAYTAADDIWSTFGPIDPNWGLPRPFGNAVVDGFDLDLETGASLGDNGNVYVTFAQALRDKFSSDTSKNYILTSAPQCYYPDATLGQVLSNVAMDYIFVQYYNNPSCRPTNYVDGSSTDAANELTNFQEWNAVASNNPGGNTKWLLGLLAAPSSADYVNQAQLAQILPALRPMSNFGGIMLWEATSASQDTNCAGVDYTHQVKDNLEGHPDFPACATSTSSAPATTTTAGFGVYATAPPGETHLAVTPDCNRWYEIVAGDTCSAIVTKSAGTLTLADFQSWNEQAQGTCNGLWASTWACVGIASASTTTSSSSVTTSSVTIPSPTQSGIVANCDGYATPAAGSGCYDFAAANGITLAQLEQWNAVLQGNGCSTSFYGGYYYCVHVSAVVTTTVSSVSTSVSVTTSSSASIPSPTQTGIDPNCDRYATPAAGSGCYDFAAANGITLAELEQWNSVLQGNGCSTSFYGGYYYCVGVKAIVTTSSSTLSTTSSVSTTSSSTAISTSSSSTVSTTSSSRSSSTTSTRLSSTTSVRTSSTSIRTSTTSSRTSTSLIRTSTSSVRSTTSSSKTGTTSSKVSTTSSSKVSTTSSHKSSTTTSSHKSSTTTSSHKVTTTTSSHKVTTTSSHKMTTTLCTKTTTTSHKSQTTVSTKKALVHLANSPDKCTSKRDTYAKRVNTYETVAVSAVPTTYSYSYSSGSHNATSTNGTSIPTQTYTPVPYTGSAGKVALSTTSIVLTFVAFLYLL